MLKLWFVQVQFCLQILVFCCPCLKHLTIPQNVEFIKISGM